MRYRPSGSFKLAMAPADAIDRDAGTASYARLTPGQHAGSVHVRLEALASGG